MAEVAPASQNRPAHWLANRISVRLFPSLAGLLLFPLLPSLEIEVECWARSCLSPAAEHLFSEMKLPRRFTLRDQLHATKFLPRCRPANEQSELSESLEHPEQLAAVLRVAF